MSKKFLIAGAGIAGLTLAKALQDLNYDYEIFEASPEVRGIGAGFGLASNAMKAFEILGLAKEVAPLGHMLEDFEIQEEGLYKILIDEMLSIVQISENEVEYVLNTISLKVAPC